MRTVTARQHAVRPALEANKKLWTRFSRTAIGTSKKEKVTDWNPHLSRHLRDLYKMAQSYEWSTCVEWSEQVFDSLFEGIVDGWDDCGALR